MDEIEGIEIEALPNDDAIAGTEILTVVDGGVGKTISINALETHLDIPSGVEDNADVTDTANVHAALGVSPTGTATDFLNEQGNFVTVTSSVDTNTQLTQAEVRAFADQAYVRSVQDAPIPNTDTQLTASTILAVLNGSSGNIDADLLTLAAGTGDFTPADHDVTEFRDVTSAGSGAIITAQERIDFAIDTNTQLDQAGVRAFETPNVDTNTQLTQAEVRSFANQEYVRSVQDAPIPNTDTQLTQAEVRAFQNPNTDTQLTQAEVRAFETPNVDTNTQLTESEVRAFADQAYVRSVQDAPIPNTDTQLTSASILGVLNGATGSIDADLLTLAGGVSVVGDYTSQGTGAGQTFFHVTDNTGISVGDTFVYVGTTYTVTLLPTATAVVISPNTVDIIPDGTVLTFNLSSITYQAPGTQVLYQPEHDAVTIFPKEGDTVIGTAAGFDGNVYRIGANPPSLRSLSDFSDAAFVLEGSIAGGGASLNPATGRVISGTDEVQALPSTASYEIPVRVFGSGVVFAVNGFSVQLSSAGRDGGAVFVGDVFTFEGITYTATVAEAFSSFTVDVAPPANLVGETISLGSFADPIMTLPTNLILDAATALASPILSLRSRLTAGQVGRMEFTSTQGTDIDYRNAVLSAAKSADGTSDFHIELAETGEEASVSSIAGNTLILTRNELKVPGIAFENLPTEQQTLHDYEEGTWTPVASLLTATDGSTVYQSPAGQYTRIGNIVKCSFQITIPANLDGSRITIRGSSLPFDENPIGNGGISGTFYPDSTAAGVLPSGWLSGTSGGNIVFYGPDGTTDTTTGDLIYFSASGDTLHGGFTYLTND